MNHAHKLNPTGTCTLIGSINKLVHSRCRPVQGGRLLKFLHSESFSKSRFIFVIRITACLLTLGLVWVEDVMRWRACIVSLEQWRVAIYRQTDRPYRINKTVLFDSPSMCPNPNPDYWEPFYLGHGERTVKRSLRAVSGAL